MSSYVVYLKVEPYLAQWFIHEQGGGYPVQLTRGSAESDILEVFLKRQPVGQPVDLGLDANLAIYIPTFKSRDPRIYNFLPPKSKKALAICIYRRFRVQLWEELHRLENVGVPISDLVYAFMEKHGIEDTPQNWETIRQMYFRKRKVYSDGYRNKNLS